MREKTRKIIPADAKLLAVPIALFGLLIILFIVTVRIGLNQVNNFNLSIQELEENSKILAQKTSTLRNLEERLLSVSDSTLIAIPEDNPLFSVVSQMRLLAQENLVVFKDLEAGGGSNGNDLNSVSVSFDVSGSVGDVSNFLAQLETISPLVTIDDIDLSEVGDEYKVSITLASYWAMLPAQIPSLTQAVESLTYEEQILLNKLSNLKKPSFSSLEAEINVREKNPFEF